MATKHYPANILDQARDVLIGCKQIDPNLQIGALTQTAFADTMAQTQTMQSQIDTLEKQLTELRNKRDDQLNTLWESVKRVRFSVKGAYGDDSLEYELVGGTRLSDRKRPGRKPQA